MKQSSNNLLTSLDYKIRREKNSCFKSKIRTWIEEDSILVRFGRLKYTRWGGYVSSMRNDCLRFYSQIRICLEGFSGRVTRGPRPRSPIIVPLRIYAWSIREKACNESAKLFHDGRDILWYSTCQTDFDIETSAGEMKSVSHPRLGKNDQTRVFPNLSC